MKYRKLSELIKLENNPRTITKEDFEILKKSISDNKDYFEARPLILSNRTGNLVIIAGNQRYEASKALGIEEVPTYVLENLTEKREREIIIRDNVNNGENDWDILLNNHDLQELKDWGVDVPDIEKDNKYNQEVGELTYTPSENKPNIKELVNTKKAIQFIKELETLDIPQEEKDFLTLSAYRHLVFDYSKIADYYAHSNDKLKEIMARHALVIIDYENAIQNGYVELTRTIQKLVTNDHGE